MRRAPGQRIDELRTLTRELNLHVPPSYFPSSTRRERYEDAVAPMVEAHTGPLHLYVGIPLCVEHCRFCMYFYGLADPAGTRSEACLRGLEQFLAAIRTGGQPVRIAASYIGGGTPSVLSATQIARLLDAVNATFSFEPLAQRTFELSPTTASADKVRAIVAGGYDRVSFGIQSFDPAVVTATGRTFAPVEDVARLVADCVDAGVREVNVDLMVGLDHESDDTLADSVAGLLRTGCDTISIYRYRPGRRTELADRGGMDQYVRRCAARVRRAIAIAVRSGWSSSGREDGEHVRLLSRPTVRWPERNLYETRFQPDLANSLIGVGVASRSFLRNERMTHCPHQPKLGYDLISRWVTVEQCDPASRVAAALVNGFFREHWVDLSLIEQQCGLAPEAVFAAEFEHLLTEGVLVRDGSRCTVTSGYRADWPYLDKLLYPPRWLSERASSTGQRIR